MMDGEELALSLEEESRCAFVDQSVDTRGPPVEACSVPSRCPR